MQRLYGWRRDYPDHRDKVYSAPPRVVFGELPRRIDFRAKCPPIQDQGPTRSCTGHMTAFLLHQSRRRKKMPEMAPSRLFPYYNAREVEGTEFFDAGASIRDLIKVVAAHGYCDEALWPFDPTKITARPVDEAYAQGSLRKLGRYERMDQSADLIRTVLAQEQPIGLGVSLFESFNAPGVESSGKVPLPGKMDGFLGGHAVALVGYSSDDQVFYFRNSYGEGWGEKGYGALTFDYVLNPNLAADLWTIELA